MLPSFVAVRSKPSRAAISRRAVSMMLGLPGATLMTWCSKPEDLVKRRTDFFFAAKSGRERSSPALAAAVERRKSRRFESWFMTFSPEGLARGSLSKYGKNLTQSAREKGTEVHRELRQIVRYFVVAR